MCILYLFDRECKRGNKVFILFGRIYKEIRLLCWEFVREKGGDSFSHGYCRASSLGEEAFCLRKTKKASLIEGGGSA